MKYSNGVRLAIVELAHGNFMSFSLPPEVTGTRKACSFLMQAEEHSGL